MILVPSFSPTAQCYARAAVLSIMSALVSRSTISVSVYSESSNRPMSTQRR